MKTSSAPRDLLPPSQKPHSLFCPPLLCCLCFLLYPPFNGIILRLYLSWQSVQSVMLLSMNTHLVHLTLFLLEYLSYALLFSSMLLNSIIALLHCGIPWMCYCDSSRNCGRYGCRGCGMCLAFLLSSLESYEAQISTLTPEAQSKIIKCWQPMKHRTRLNSKT